MSDPILETKRLCQSYGLDFKDFGNGHVQISGHGQLINYYPNSKKRTLYSPTLKRKEQNCTPWDAVKLCIVEASEGIRPSARLNNKPCIDLNPKTTNPAGLRHFYQDEAVPPWDDSLGEFTFTTESDELRAKAWQLEKECLALRAKANDLDESD